MRVKICGIRRPDQGRAIVELGATALGFICVPQSPRYVTPAQIRAIVEQLPPDRSVDRVGVFVNEPIAVIEQVVQVAGLTAVQLHGDESPLFCQQLRDRLPRIELIRAFRVRQAESLTAALLNSYDDCIDTFLLDAYHPTQWGGTGQTLDWTTLQPFRPNRPWLLAGGLTPDNVRQALALAQPDGIDLSSGVELSPGEKDLQQVARLFQQLLQPLS